MFDRTNAAQLTALRNEIQTDPQALGYAPFVSGGQDGAVCDVINFIRDGVTAAFNGVVGTAITVRRSDVSPNEVLEAIDLADLITTATTIQCSWLESITQTRTMRLLNDDGTNTRVLSNLRSLLAAGSQSRTRLNNVANRNGSRAESLFGTGTVIVPDDVAKALRG